jgi:hypothetical protein
LAPAGLLARVDEAYFRAAYDADAANRAKQPWDEYRSWVQRFYDGQRFPPIPGWSKRADDLARRHAAARADVRERLDAVGKLIAAEWAKDNGVRKVSTGDLQAWGKTLDGAQRDADALVRALRDVEDEVRRRTGGV